LSKQRFAQPSQQICLDEYAGAIEQATARIQRLEAQLRELVSVWSLGPVVSAMTAHRGVSLLVAATVCAELGDLTRFGRARDLMGFVGLVPSLHSTGLTRRAGAITKTGNSHVRRVLVEAAWAYRHPARQTVVLRKRLEGQPEEVQAISWKGQLRLCGRYRKLIARGKHPNKVTTAVARELLAFLWDTARLVSPMSPAV
jgi:transposase